MNAKISARKLVLSLLTLLFFAIYAYGQVYVYDSTQPGFDFRIYWTAAQSVSRGQSPYREGLDCGYHRYIYPPLLANLLSPFARTATFEEGNRAWIVLNTFLLAAAVYRVGRCSQR